MVRKSVGIVLSLALAPVLVVTMAGSPALAKWRIHSHEATEINAPPGGTEDQICSDRLEGTNGWTEFVDTDPAAFPIPPEAYLPVTYELWKAPPGFTDFQSQAQESVDANGVPTGGWEFTDPVTLDPVPASLVENFTTPPRTAVTPPIPVNGTPGGDIYVFTTAPFNQALTGVLPGDVLGLKPTTSQAWLTLGAINCDPTEAYEFAGFKGSVNAPPIVNLGHSGRSYFVRFRLKDANGDYVTNPSAISDISYQRVDCSTFAGRPTDAIEWTAWGPSKLYVSKWLKQFVYRWRTPATPGCSCYTLTFEFGGYLQQSVDFKLR